ncbi:hypothetical protein [Mycobacterium kubicae]|uniref:hypothetical protein n=1 Tax=Mycobacterium kubicae TaxID=120959 RepID=UPI000B2F0BA4|nr:hypothetical protein [Mycobacterium kubicae]
MSTQSLRDHARRFDLTHLLLAAIAAATLIALCHGTHGGSTAVQAVRLTDTTISQAPPNLLGGGLATDDGDDQAQQQAQIALEQMQQAEQQAEEQNELATQEAQQAEQQGLEVEQQAGQ